MILQRALGPRACHEWSFGPPESRRDLPLSASFRQYRFEFRKYRYERWSTAGAMNRDPTDGLELAFKRRGAIYCTRADEPQYLAKLINA